MILEHFTFQFIPNFKIFLSDIGEVFDTKRLVNFSLNMNKNLLMINPKPFNHVKWLPNCSRRVWTSGFVGDVIADVMVAS